MRCCRNQIAGDDVKDGYRQEPAFAQSSRETGIRAIWQRNWHPRNPAEEQVAAQSDRGLGVRQCREFFGIHNFHAAAGQFYKALALEIAQHSGDDLAGGAEMVSDDFMCEL